VANISKLLFAPQSRPIAARRAAYLRSRLGIDDESVFGPLGREMRDHFEHFDERLDNWVQTQRSNRLADRTIAPVGYLDEMFGTGNCLRNLDPKLFVITFRDSNYELLPVLEAVHDLLRRVAPIIGSNLEWEN
jgi:hypothetical protein